MSIYHTNALNDLPLYEKDFFELWKSSVKAHNKEELAKNYHLTLLYKNWKIALNHIDLKECDMILEELNQDINASFYLAHFGLYRTSLMHIRSTIELTMQLLYFYDHKIEYLQWNQGTFVIKHADLIEYFIKHPNFQNDLKEEILKLLPQITKYWKQFSKYIHAEAPNYFQSTQQTHIENKFNQKDFNIWQSNFQKSIYLLNKLVLLFFRESFNRFPSAQREVLTHGISKEDIKLLIPKSIKAKK